MKKHRPAAAALEPAEPALCRFCRALLAQAQRRERRGAAHPGCWLLAPVCSSAAADTSLDWLENGRYRRLAQYGSIFGMKVTKRRWRFGRAGFYGSPLRQKLRLCIVALPAALRQLHPT